MGCDIHLFIEYKVPSKFPNRETFYSFGGEMWRNRNYNIFAKLAGIRNGYNIKPISKPRGLPEDIGDEAKARNELFIFNSKNEEEDYITPEEAEKYIAQGSSKRIDENHIAHPDWHSHSWVTADELDQVFADPLVDFYKYPDCVDYAWIAIRDTLRSFEKQGCQARIVFWFDS